MSSAVKTPDAVSQLAGNVTERMTVAILQMNPKKSVVRSYTRLSNEIYLISFIMDLCVMYYSQCNSNSISSSRMSQFTSVTRENKTLWKSLYAIAS